MVAKWVSLNGLNDDQTDDFCLYSPLWSPIMTYYDDHFVNIRKLTNRAQKSRNHVPVTAAGIRIKPVTDRSTSHTP